MTPRPVILFEGGDVPASLAYRAGKLGVDACPHVEFLDIPAPCVLMAPLPLLETGFTGGLRGFIEYRAEDAVCPLSAEAVEAVAQGGLCLSACTTSMLSSDPAQVFCAAVRKIAPAIGDMMIELALAEALGNSIIHGNLGLQSDLRHSLAGLVEFNTRLAQRLADPTLASRRVTVTAIPLQREGISISVTDDGDGFDIDHELKKPVDVAAKSGRGLGLIRKVSSEIEGSNGGRTLTMRFLRTG